MTQFRIFLAASLLLSGSAGAADCRSGKVIFFCKTQQAKLIQACDFGNKISYTYGSNLSKPEIRLIKKRSEVYAEPWHGVGKIHYSIEIPNGRFSYHPFARAVDRDNEVDVEAGVFITDSQDGSYYRQVLCKIDSLEQSIEVTDLSERAQP